MMDFVVRFWYHDIDDRCHSFRLDKNINNRGPLASGGLAIVKTLKRSAAKQQDCPCLA